MPPTPRPRQRPASAYPYNRQQSSEPQQRNNLRSRQRQSCDDFSDLFKHKDDGELKAPNSCIESAEFIIQRIAKNKKRYAQPAIKDMHYVQGQANVPHVVAHFGKKKVAKKEGIADGLKKLREEGYDIKVTDDEVIINVTTNDKLHKAGEKLSHLGIELMNYNFEKKKRLPEAGQGLIFLTQVRKGLRVQHALRSGGCSQRY